MTEQARPNQLNRASNELLEATSFLSAANAGFIESLYAQWLENPETVEPSWAAWFSELGQKGITQEQLTRRTDWTRATSSQADGELLGALTGLWPPRKSEVSAADTRSAA